MKSIVFEGMTWPLPDQEMDDLDWTLRYCAKPRVVDLLNAASVVSAYIALVRKTQQKRNHICAVMNKKKPRKEAEDD